MLRQVTTRNQRVKGFTVKSALQVCLLVVICAWILYQLKHSYDQRKPDQESAAVKRIHSKDKHAQRGARKTGRIKGPRAVDSQQQYEDASREARESSFAGDDASSEVVQAAAPMSQDSEGFNSSAAKLVDVAETRVAMNESDAHMELGAKDLMIHSTATNLEPVSGNKNDGARKHKNATNEKTDGTFAKVIVQGKNEI